MLQRIQAQIGHLGGFGMSEDTAHTAMVVEAVVLDLDEICHAVTGSLPSNRLRTAGRQSQININANTESLNRSAGKDELAKTSVKIKAQANQARIHFRPTRLHL